MKRWIFIILVFGLILGYFGFALAQSSKSNGVEVNFFYSQTCPHCTKEKLFLENLEKKYPEVEVKKYEVTRHPENQKILKDFYEKYQVPKKDKGWVPATFTSTKYFIGFNQQIGENIENCLKECLDKGEKGAAQEIKIPFFGKVDISKMSLPVLTVALGTLDGFNPCAMWVLIILISLLLSLKSRKKIALVGGIFIFAEGLLYFLFMTAWLNLFLVISYVSLTRILIGFFGIGFGAWRIRDFIFWKPGVCKVVDHSKSEEKIIDRIKNVLRPTTVPATIFGMVALAFGVNLVEFFCSAGFPVMYTRILALQNIGFFQHYLYLVFYNFFYMLDDLIVFGFALITLSKFGFSDRYNKYSTLITGVLILILGFLLIFRPEILMFG